jgi:hypothetical protein
LAKNPTTKNRKAVVETGGVTYRDKQESLDFIDFLEQNKTAIHGVEIVCFSGDLIKTDVNKTVWFTSQDGVYTLSRQFLRQKMGGLWQYAEVKT